PELRLSEGLQGSKEDLLRVAQEFGLEGLVANRKNSVYESGRRSGAWVKVKLTKAQEFVIGGYTLPGGARQHWELITAVVGRHFHQSDQRYYNSKRNHNNRPVLRSKQALKLIMAATCAAC